MELPPDRPWEPRLDAEPWQSRVDRGALMRPHLRDDGSMLVAGVAVREGILSYSRPDGSTFRELVPLSTITDSATGLGRLPLVLQHPDPRRHPLGVTPENVSELQVGDVDGSVEIGDGGFTVVKLAIRRKDALDAVRAGTQELSPGYDVQIDPTPGVHPVYGAFDGTQVKRRYNHLALVDRARGGSEVRIRADGVANDTLRADGAPNHAGAPARSSRMQINPALVAILASLGLPTRHDSEDGALAVLSDALRSRNDAADTATRNAAEALATAVRERDEARTALATATTERDAQRTRADAAETERTRLQTEAKTRADADERARLVPVAKRAKIDAAKHPVLADLRRALAATRMPTGELRADASDAYVQVLVDQACEEHRDDGFASGRAAWTGAPAEERTDAAPARLLSENERHAARIEAARKANA